MGVIYKLTEDVVQYILDEKQKAPELSCRELVDKVAGQFQRDVSKSSVHEVLKQAHISGPRGRKAKNKFQIPAAKKAQLQALLPPLPDVSMLPAPVVTYVTVPPVPDILPPLETLPVQETLGDIILTAAFADIFPKPWKEIKNYKDLKTIDWNMLEQELHYRTLSVCNFKLDLENGEALYIDSRFQALSRHPQQQECPVEKALAEMADHILNNIEPIAIKEVMASSVEELHAFLDALEGKKGRNITKITLLDPQNIPVADFAGVLPQRRKFLIGIYTQIIDNKQFTISENVQSAPVYGFSSPIRFVSKDFTWPGGRCRSLTVLGAQDEIEMVVLSNLPASVKDADVLRRYLKRHPGGRLTFRLPAPGAKASGSLEFLKNYAEGFFAQPLTDEDWRSLMAITTETSGNDQLALSRPAALPDHPPHSSLQQAMLSISALGLSDSQGRQIRLNSP